MNLLPGIPNPFTTNSFTAGSIAPTNTLGFSITNSGYGGAVGTTPNNTFLGSASIQMFRTIPVPNRLANLFTIQVRQRNLALASLGVANLSPLAKTYTFPISPAGYIRNINAVATKYMTKGQGSGTGTGSGQVSYSFDEYGYTPPSFLIEGTTGWKYHTLDGGQWSGYQSFHNLKSILEYYFDVNNGVYLQNAKYDMYLYDYYNQSYWQVVPVGNQTFSMSENAPLNGYYRIYLEGIRDISAGKSPIELKSVLSQIMANAIVGAANTVASVIAPIVGVISDVGNTL